MNTQIPLGEIEVCYQQDRWILPSPHALRRAEKRYRHRVLHPDAIIITQGDVKRARPPVSDTTWRWTEEGVPEKPSLLRTMERVRYLEVEWFGEPEKAPNAIMKALTKPQPEPANSLERIRSLDRRKRGGWETERKRHGDHGRSWEGFRENCRARCH